MEILFVSLERVEGAQPYDGLLDAMKAAKARSGCRVWCIADHPVKCENFIRYDSCYNLGNSVMQRTDPGVRKQWATPALLRTFAGFEFAKSRNDLEWPVFPLDHDILVFSDLREVYKPLLKFDFCAPVYGAGTTGAYSIHSLDVWEACVNRTLELVGNKAILNDMVSWAEMYQSGKWKIGNLLKEPVEGAFDMNMHLSENRYVMEASTVPMWGKLTKKITWVGGHPYFHQVLDNELIRAHWIHCWGSYKFRTKELIEKAGL